MKNVLKISKYVLMSLITVFIFSCDGEDGEDGLNGIDGQTGAQGSAGADGVNGQDGNANIQAFIFDQSEANDTFIGLTIPEITQDVLDTDIVLAYLFTPNLVHPIPAPNIPLGDSPIDVSVDLQVGQFSAFFFEVGTNTAVTINQGDVQKLKIIIIESTSTPQPENQGSKVFVQNSNRRG